MKYHIKTYGCQMNHSDSERIAGVLELAGYKKTSQESEADLIVINMCSVRKSAVDRIAGNFKKYKKYKKKNPKLKTVLTGCVLKSDKKRFEKLFDLVIDIKEIEKLPKKLTNCHSELDSESAKNNDLTVPISSKLSATEVGKVGCNKQKILNQVQNDNTQVQDDNTQVQNDKDKLQIGNINDYFHINPQHQSKITAYVPIMTGCNNFCSYCVVPYTRGREYSRPAEEIIDEITRLVRKGYKEIILLGQNVNSYESSIKYQVLSIKQDLKMAISSNPTIEQSNNRTLNFSPSRNPSVGDRHACPLHEKTQNSINFPELLKLINNIPGNFWIRFLTSHPKDVTEELLKTIAECEKCVECIHLALQSGDNEILQKMNRKYTAKHFLDLVKMIRKYIPDAAITTDVIVGFPSETEKQFQNTAEVMKKARFDMVYINKYSPREGTASYKMKDDVNWEEKKKREIALNKILKETALENNQKYIGRVIDVLVEKIDDDFIYGKTRSFKNVKINAGSIVAIPLLRGARGVLMWNRCANLNTKRLHSPKGTMEPTNGQFVKIKITQAGAWGLEGEMVK